MAKTWFAFQGIEQTFDDLGGRMPNLEVLKDGDNFFLWHPDLIAAATLPQTWQTLHAFADRANDLLLVIEPSNSHSIRPHGAIKRQHGDGAWHYELLPIGAQLEVTLGAVRLHATATSGAPTQPVGSLDARVGELKGRAPHFADALRFLRGTDDFPSLYKAIEAVERGNGGFPGKKEDKNSVRRAEFCRKIGFSEMEWEQLHASARPARHAYPHASKYTPLSFDEAKLVVLRSIQNWLVREEPS